MTKGRKAHEKRGELGGFRKPGGKPIIWHAPRLGLRPKPRFKASSRCRRVICIPKGDNRKEIGKVNCSIKGNVLA